RGARAARVAAPGPRPPEAEGGRGVHAAVPGRPGQPRHRPDAGHLPGRRRREPASNAAPAPPRTESPEAGGRQVMNRTGIELEQAIAAGRGGEAPPGVAGAAAARAWERVVREAGIASGPAATIRGCAD